MVHKILFTEGLYSSIVNGKRSFFTFVLSVFQSLVLIKSLYGLVPSNRPKSHFIADMGCGEAALAKRVAHSVRSFDLVAAAPGVEACDMAHTPLLAASMDAVVYCLALMGTELTKYLLEANRVLKMG